MSDSPRAEQDSRRQRVSRPTPTHLFAQRQTPDPSTPVEGQRPPPPRATRVIPALAGIDVPIADATTRSRPGDRIPEYPPDLVFIVREDGKVLFVNRPLGRRGEEDVIGSDIYDWIFPEQHQLVRDCLARVFASSRGDGHELNGIQHHDPDAWYECRVSPNLRDARVVSATIIARDVTRFRIAEQELTEELATTKRLLEERVADLEHAKGAAGRRATETDADRADQDRFRALLDEAGEAVFITDATTHELVDLNETGSRWLREPREELIGRNASALDIEFDILPPDDADLVFTETRDTRRPLVLDGGVHRRDDGSTFPVEVTVAHHRIGTREYVLAIVRDVKGRRHAEEALRQTEAQYQALFEQSWDAVYLTTRAGRIETANPAAFAMFGYEEEDFVGMDARDLLPRADDIRTFQREMAEHGVVGRVEARFRAARGEEFDGFLSATCRRDPAGRLLGYQWIVRRETSPDPRPVTAEHAASAPIDRRTVLVVDPEERVIAETRSVLEHAGMRVLSAPDAEQALQLFRANASDVGATVMATALAETGSGAAVRAIRHIDPDARIVLVTSDDPYAVAERFADIRISAYLRRPAHPLTLVQTVRDLVHAASNGR